MIFSTHFSLEGSIALTLTSCPGGILAVGVGPERLRLRTNGRPRGDTRETNRTRVKLTDKLIKTVEAPQHGQLKIWDSEVGGFICRVTPTGTNTFLLNYRLGRVRRQVKIGRYPAWSVLAARKRAQELAVQVDQGEDPATLREERRNAPLVEDLYGSLLPIYEKKAPRTCADRKQMWTRSILPALGRKRVDAVTIQDIETLHREKTEKGHPYAANRLVEVLRHGFNKAILWKMRADNPALGIERNPELPRERYLSIAEYHAFLDALPCIDNQQSADALRLLALTGARMSEVLSATWDQFDLSNAVWIKPAATTK